MFREIEDEVGGGEAPHESMGVWGAARLPSRENMVGGWVTKKNAQEKHNRGEE